MKISMIGIDHSKASIEFREKFAFTKSKITLALNKIKSIFNPSGVVIISTCNRTEIWLSNFEDENNLYKIIGEIYELDETKYREYFSTRCGIEAVDHLFELSCGLKSKIIGEDQILTQVKESAAIARESGTIDAILEKLFQMAITSAKRVKTNVRLTPVDASVATKTLELLKLKFQSIEDLNCLVIGNGEIGKLTAKALADAGCSVKMTLRQYKRGAVVIPSGCSVIQYEDRIDYVNSSDVIVSATLSPHYTITFNEIENILDSRKRIFIDLAMPRDIESKIGEIPSVELFDVDTLSDSSKNENLSRQITEAREILEKYVNEFKDFYYYRDIKKRKYQIIKKDKVNI